MNKPVPITHHSFQTECAKTRLQSSTAMFFVQLQRFMVIVSESLKNQQRVSSPVLKDFPQTSAPLLLYAFFGVINLSGLRKKVKRPQFLSD